MKTASCTGTEDPGCVRLCVRNALHPRDLDTAVTRCAQLSCDAFVGCYREVLETARKERQRQE